MSRIDAEASVLGACLVDAQAYWRVADMLGPDDFTTGEYRDLWETIARLSRENVAPDFVTVGDRLSGLAMDLAGSTPGSANVQGYAKWVAAAATERRVQAAGQRIAKLRGEDVVGEAQRILATCQPRNSTAVRSIREFLRDTVATMQERCDATDALTGVETSLPWLDEMTSGWQRGDLIIVAARPSVGKTAFAIQSALHAASLGGPVFFASLEQSGSQITERAMAHLSGVSLQSIRQPKRIEEHEWPRITNAGADIDKLPIFIDETGALPFDSISARARQINASHRLSLIVIDYLQQIAPPRADKMADAIQVITRGLKALAKELAVPIILLSQLNREGAERPQLKHLRDSGAIEQDADVVIFLHRPEETNRELIELIIGKQRNGPIGHAFLHAAMDKMQFSETEERPVERVQTRGFGRARNAL